MNILFIGVGNSDRSQMAEGMARTILGKKFNILSAGPRPSEIHPLAIVAMNEIGIDISDQRSKAVSEIDLEAMDFTITLCAEEDCTVISGKAKKLHWGFADPKAIIEPYERQILSFREVRDGLLAKIYQFKLSLDAK